MLSGVGQNIVLRRVETKESVRLTLYRSLKGTVNADPYWVVVLLLKNRKVGKSRTQ